jgi:prophage antirepressor-like protein
MNTVKTFMNANLGNVRVVTNENGEWFVAKDVCDILEIGNPSDVMRRLDDDEKMTLDSIESHSGQRGGAQQINVVNEYGLWQMVLGSRKPQAKEFKRWLTHEVIPAIRKNGGYIDGQEFVPAEEKAKLEAEVCELHRMAQDYKYQNDRLTEKVDRLAKIIEKDTTGDFAKRKKDGWTEADLYDLDVEGYDEFQSEMELFNFSDYALMEELKSIINSAKPNYIDKSAAKYLIGEINRLFVDRNA